MIVRAAVVPHPPLLVPELVAGAAKVTQDLRSACLAAARSLSEAAVDWLAIAADPTGPATFGPSAAGSFAAYGVPVPVSLSPTAEAGQVGGLPGADLPLPVLIAGWLRGQVAARHVEVRLVDPDLPATACRCLGGELFESAARSAEPVGLLVLGDGSNRHPDGSTAPADDRAEPFDAEVTTALATADAMRLLKVDAGLATELGAGGRVAWQVLAGVALASGERWRSETLYADSPFGVGYHVAVWDPEWT
ncbi:MAG TPA: class III extradiol dioxygenase subunit B-like domain-containing protein [Pseudonocardiaceae bacterium]